MGKRRPFLDHKSAEVAAQDRSTSSKLKASTVAELASSAFRAGRDDALTVDVPARIRDVVEYTRA